MTCSRRGVLAGIGSLATVMVLPAMAAELLQVEGRAFGDRWALRVESGNFADRAIIAAISDVIDRVDRSMSPFRADSELSAFNLANTTDWWPVSVPFYETVAEARRIARQTGGAFDPTLGGLVGRYGFGPITTLPAGEFAGLGLAEGQVRKAHPRQTLDLCGIAKGHALDMCMGALRKLGLDNYVLAIGGEVRTSGKAPEGRHWRIGIEDPRDPHGPPACTIMPQGRAVATSGSRVNGYSYAGRRYSHIIDPTTHSAETGRLLSVTVVKPVAITADAMATALFAMGIERGVAFAMDHEIEALFQIGNAVRAEQIATGRFTDLVISE